MGSSASTTGPPTPSSATWHICWRAALGRNLLPNDETLGRIRARALKSHARPGAVLIDFLLTPLEIHLVARFEDPRGPARMAAGFGNAVSRWIRDLEDDKGPVFSGHFLVRRLEDDAAVRTAVRMLAWRPVALCLCALPVHYPHGGYRIALGLLRGDGFSFRPLIALFPGHLAQARDALRTLVNTPLRSGEVQAWELTMGLRWARVAAPSTAGSGGGTGSGAGTQSRPLRNAAAAALVAASPSADIAGALTLLDTWATRRLSHVDPSAPRSSATARRATRSRAVVACIAVDIGLCPSAAVARHFRRARSTLCAQMAACRSREDDARLVATPVDVILAELARAGR